MRLCVCGCTCRKYAGAEETLFDETVEAPPFTKNVDDAYFFTRFPSPRTGRPVILIVFDLRLSTS